MTANQTMDLNGGGVDRRSVGQTRHKAGGKVMGAPENMTLKRQLVLVHAQPEPPGLAQNGRPKQI